MKRTLICLTFVMMLCSGCSIDKKLANDFVISSSSADFVLYMTDCLDKVNARFDFTDEEIDTMDVMTRDSIIDSKIKIVNKLDDNLVLDIFYGSFVSTLTEEYGVPVRYVESDSVDSDSLHWVLYIPKIEIEESRFELDNSYYSFVLDNYVPSTYDATNINLALWIEINDGTWGKVLYGEQNLAESLKGNGGSFFNNINANPQEIDTIDIDDVYKFTAYAGRLYASYTYDYMLNKYVKEKLYSKGLKTSRYFRYNPIDGDFYPAEKDKFTEIE